MTLACSPSLLPMVWGKCSFTSFSNSTSRAVFGSGAETHQELWPSQCGPRDCPFIRWTWWGGACGESSHSHPPTANSKDIYVTVSSHTCAQWFHAAHGSFHAGQQERQLCSFPSLNMNSSLLDVSHTFPQALRRAENKPQETCSQTSSGCSADKVRCAEHWIGRMGNKISLSQGNSVHLVNLEALSKCSSCWQ